MSFRIEQKIPILPAQVSRLLEDIITQGAKRLHPDRTVRSTYFDNEKLKLYVDSEEGLLPRKKFRIRTYPDEKRNRFYLEKKISSYEGRYKTVEHIDAVERERLLHNGIFDSELGAVMPTLIVQYNRQYFELDGIRVTMDDHITYEVPGRARTVTVTDSMCVFEVKSQYGVSQQILEDLMASQRGRFSKYCRGLQALKII